MTTIGVEDAIEARIAGRLRARRAELGLSLGEVAARSGVSKAMVGKVEAATSSPTAGTLGRLCAGLGITMSALMAAVESEDAVHLAAAAQPRWADPDTGLVRTALSPRAGAGAVEIARVRLPVGAVVDYPTPPRIAFAQQLVGLTGRVRFTLGEREFTIAAGDCVSARIDRPTRFASLGRRAAEYLVVVEGAG